MAVPRLSAGVITADLTRLPAPSTRRRIQAVRELAAACGADVLVGVDGGVTVANAAEIAGWGPDVIVSGSAIFDRRSPARNLAEMTHALQHPVAAPIEEVAHVRQ